MKATLFIGAVVLLLLSGCGDSGDGAKINPPPAQTATKASADTGTGTGVAASTATAAATSTGASTGVAATTATGTGTATDTKADAGERTNLGTSPHSVAMPASWKISDAKKPMRAMTVIVSKSEGDADDAEMGVFIFGGGGGGLDPNVKRWVDQFGGNESAIKGRRDVKTEAGATAKVVELAGDFTDKMNGLNKTNYKMLGAFIEAEGTAYIFKLIGPPKTLDAHKAEFDKVIGSFK